MADFLITDTLANKVLGYLGTKPFNEVAGIINELAQIKPVPGPETKKDEENKD